MSCMSNTPCTSDKMATGGNPTITEGMEAASEMYGPIETKAVANFKESLDEFTFHNEEAGIVVKFFEEELLRIANKFGGKLSREPVLGQPEKVTIICTKEKHFKDLQRSVENIRKDMQQCHKKYVTYESRYNEVDVEKFVKQSRGNSSTLVYLDTRNEQVCVAGKNYEDVMSEVHKLKVHLGITKMTVRRRRNTLDDASAVDTPLPPSKPVPMNPDVSDDSNRSLKSFAEKSSDTLSDITEFYVKETLNRSLVLKVYGASILEVNVDVIVSPANGALLHNAGAAKTVADAAGDDLKRESKEYNRKNGQMSVTQNCVTTAGRLRRYKGVIHAVGPEWKMYSDTTVKCLDDLYDTVTNILQLCTTKRYDYVAMPAICAGTFGVPKRLCADMYVKAAADFSKRNERHPKELHIVDIDTEVLGLVKDSFDRWKVDETSLDQRKTVPECFKVGDAATVLIYNGAIESVVCVDAFACAADESLNPVGPIAKALENAGGPSYHDALHDMRKVNNVKKRNTGDVAVSKGGDLKVPNVIHLVVPKGFSEQDIFLFKTAMSNILEEAERKKFRAIALPLIGTANILSKHVLLSNFCDGFVETVCAFFAKKSDCCVKEMHLVNKSHIVCTALSTAFDNMAGITHSISRRDRPLPPVPPVRGKQPDSSRVQRPADSTLRGNLQLLDNN